ncbi:MAG TPA: hypothetical protein PK156_34310 [Polyangium sp.]|nr:hypothetical protein [Polyangium sp.]
MRSPHCFVPLTLLVASLTTACGNKSQDATPSPSASPTASGPEAEIHNAPPSPFSVVLESAKPLVFSGMTGGIVVADEQHTHVATQVAGAEITLASMFDGLPQEGKPLRFQGKLPGSVWLWFEVPAEGKNSPKNPLFRLDNRKKTWKKWTDDWKPLLASWSNNRVLSMSTSSGKLKIRVVEPHRDKPEADWPSAKLGDETCEKSIKVEGLTTWASGDVFAAGHCKASGGARKYVLVHWPVASANAAASASAGPAPTPPGPLPSASAAVPTAAASAAAVEPDAPSPELVDAGVTDAGEAPVVDIGVHGVVHVFPDAPAQIEHRDLVTQADQSVWALANARDGAAHLYRFDGQTAVSEELPKAVDGAGRSIAAADDGTLWFVTEREIWKRAPAAQWEKVPPPTGHWREAGPKWDFSSVWSTKGDVWIAGTFTSAKGGHHVVLRLRASKDTVMMP